MEDDSQAYLPWKFNPPGFDDCEDLERYEPGGYHPVHLEDAYDANRYRVMHKLGSGGFSTVWLARDTQNGVWVGLKFIVADDSEHYEARSSATLEDAALASSDFVVKTERRFWVDGPNGRHLCLVLALVGPNLSTLSSGIYARLTPAFATSLSYQAAQAMDALHSSAKCHGGMSGHADEPFEFSLG